ncbi:MAG: right-handed parallel beta-helix repeat-containing protein [Acidimicrobiales bacterium]
MAFVLTVGVLLVLSVPVQRAGDSVQVREEADRAPRITAVTIQAASPGEPEDAEASGASSRPPTAVDEPCTLFVAADGADDSDGTQAERSLQTAAAAVSRAVPGDVVCFSPGAYVSPNGSQGALHIEDKHGTAAEPITFRSQDLSDPAVFTMGSVEAGRGVSVVFIQRSSYITIDGLEITEGFRGVTGNGVSNVRLINSKIHRTGGEIVSFGRRAGRIEPEVSTNPISSLIEISSNEISDSGLADGDPFGEGIYLGTSEPSYRDDSHSFLISDNFIHDVVDEAIDVKTGVWGVTVTNNRIESIDVNSQGAVTISLQGENWEDGQYLISGNTISDVTTRNVDGVAIWIGHGNTVVENNVIWDVADSGIYIPNTFNMDNARNVVLSNNTIWNTGQSSIEHGNDWNEISSSPPILQLDQTNLTWDGSDGTTRIDACDGCVPKSAGPTSS